jgi:4'-phosphopantetheinyl transferase EntD
VSLSALHAALRAAFPGAGIGVVPISEGAPGALPVIEAAAIARASDKRRMEFAAGRMAAARAMAMLGRAAVPVPAGADRAPIWPSGLCGSISHAGGWAVAVVSADPRIAALGLDMEPEVPLEEGLWPSIFSATEQDMAAKADHPGLFALQVFVAKEAAYKAQYPLSQTLFDFHTLQTRWQEERFFARFTTDCPPFPCGAELSGKVLRACGLLIAAVTVPRAENSL